MYVVEDKKIVDQELADFVSKIFDIKQQGDPWAVIDELIKYWLKKTPEEAEAVKIDVADQREMLIDKEYGSTTGGKDLERRFTLLFPTTLSLWIRKVFGTDELPFDRKFYKEFAKRYPGFKIPEKV